MNRLDEIVISPAASIVEAIAQLDKAGTGALALCAEGRQLYGLLTDGDIRRAILNGVSLDDPCGTIASRNPFIARMPITARKALQVMTEHDINHLPVLDEGEDLVEFLLRRDLIQEDLLDVSAVIMAGGFGQRLHPLTKRTPKPMLPVGDQPLLERMIRQLGRAGIREVSLTTHYLPETIAKHFGNGDALGVNITYSNENQPLGTAGGLKLIKSGDGPLLVINGDILTGVSFEEMLRYHRRHGAEMTVGVRKHEVKVPFGVVECDEARVRDLREKPALTLLINAGVYLVERSACEYIPDGERFDMTDLIKKMLDDGRPIVSFPIIEYWQDVGCHEDYMQAQEDVRNGRI